MNKLKDTVCIVCGSDANAYYMSRCWHELTNTKALVLAKSPLPYTEYSDILDIKYNSTIWEEEGFLSALYNIKQSICKKYVLLIASNETYSGFISKNKDELTEKGFLFNYPDKNIINTFMYKDKFYKAYENSPLAFAKTYYYDCATDTDLPENLTYPLVLKPANVIAYNHLNFANKCKIYKVNNQTEAQGVINNLKYGGYRDTLIIQDFIPGDDSYLFDCVVYCDKYGSVKMQTLAQIGLQEQTKNMVGNAAVLINGINTHGENGDILSNIKSFMQSTGYTGFAELDLKYDYRDGCFKVLEINARQGRCSFYINTLGCNPVRLLYEDLVENNIPDYGVLSNKALLSFVPWGIVKKYCKDEKFKAEAIHLWKTRVSPVKYSKDKNLKRRLYLLKKKFRYYKDYKNSYWSGR